MVLEPLDVSPLVLSAKYQTREVPAELCQQIVCVMHTNIWEQCYANKMLSRHKTTVLTKSWAYKILPIQTVVATNSWAYKMLSIQIFVLTKCCAYQQSCQRKVLPSKSWTYKIMRIQHLCQQNVAPTSSCASKKFCLQNIKKITKAKPCSQKAP